MVCLYCFPHVSYRCCVAAVTKGWQVDTGAVKIHMWNVVLRESLCALQLMHLVLLLWSMDLLTTHTTVYAEPVHLSHCSVIKKFRAFCYGFCHSGNSYSCLLCIIVL